FSQRTNAQCGMGAVFSSLHGKDRPLGHRLVARDAEKDVAVHWVVEPWVPESAGHVGVNLADEFLGEGRPQVVQPLVVETTAQDKEGCRRIRDMVVWKVEPQPSTWEIFRSDVPRLAETSANIGIMYEERAARGLVELSRRDC